MLDEQWFKELLNEPLRAIWNALLRIWWTEKIPEDLKAFYDEREASVYHFERLLSDLFPELYDILLEQSLKQEGEYVLKWLVDNNAVIIADSLSVREAVLLKHYFPELDFVPESPFAIAPFPTRTESLAQKLLNVSAPSSGHDTAKFAYRYVAGVGAIDQQDYPSDRPLLVWLRLPDEGLEQVTEAQTITIQYVVKRTKEVLKEIFRRLEGRKIIVTSDHGYFYGAQPQRHFDDLIKVLTGVTVRKRLYDEKLQLNASQREYFVEHDKYVAVKGRYWWGEKGQNAPHTAHGGFSLMEIFVPVLKVAIAPQWD